MIAFVMLDFDMRHGERKEGIMARKSLKSGAFLIFGWLCAASGAGQEKSISLTLNDCIAMAMRHNLGVAVEVLNPAAGAEAVALAKEKFMPVFAFSHERSSEHQAVFSWFDASDQVDQSYSISTAALRQALPTGGALSAEFSASKYDTTERALTINPSYRSSLRFEFKQPLLRDFGPQAARSEIIIARNSLDMMNKGLDKALQDTVYRVEEAYWNLVQGVEDLKIKQSSLRLAQDLLERNRKAAKAGTLASVNVLNAETQVAVREADILKAEAAVRNAEDELKLVINLPAENKEADVLRIAPREEIALAKTDVSLDEAMAIALQHRPDLEALRIGVRAGEFDVSLARNQSLPGLNFSGSLWSPGVSGTRLIYPPSDPFGDPIARIPGGRADSLKDVFGFKFVNVSLGVSLDVPVGNLLSRAAYARARVGLEQKSLEVKRLEQEIQTRVRIALRDVEMNFERIQTLKRASELARKQLEAEEEKLKAGYSTSYFVLQYQSELSLQRSQELAAMIEYRMALAGLSRELGTSLAERNIRVGETSGK
jgi:outer membrane protein TolC